MAKKNKKSNMECGTMKNNGMDMGENCGMKNNGMNNSEMDSMMDDCGCGSKTCK